MTAGSRPRLLPLAQLQLLYYLDNLLGSGDALMLLIEPGEFLNKPPLLIVIWQAPMLVLKGIERHAHRVPSPLGTCKTKPDESLHIQGTSSQQEVQPRSEIPHR